MLSYEKGIVLEIQEENEDISWLIVEINGKEQKAVNYVDLTGYSNIGDKVVLNTTAIELSLGTGGQHFVIYNFSNKISELSGPGHIMKMRYTPYQSKFLSAEEEDGPFHKIVNEFESLEEHPVIIGTLHSMLGPIACSLKYFNEDLKINYIMTDDAAIPMAFSKMVKELKSKNIIDNTITVDQAFGGDFECVNLYTGLIVSKDALNADVTIVTMGPGIVGTGTKYGFTGISQGHQIDMVNNLGGKPIIVPRISFEDKRERHYGLSHHSRTVLKDISRSTGDLVIPKLKGRKKDVLKSQINEDNLREKYTIIEMSGDHIGEVFKKYNLNVKTMGRGLKEDKEFFKTLGAVGKYVGNL